MKKLLFNLLIILDVFLVGWVSFYTEYIIIAIFLHVMLFIFLWRLYIHFDDKIEDIPVYIVLFMPGLGGLILLIFYFSMNYFINDNYVLYDYEQLLDYKISMEKKEIIDYEREIRTMSFIDMLSFLEPEKKKEILIDSQYNAKINNTMILKKALEEKDKEVQHYSATLLNSRENEFSNNISYLRDQYNEIGDERILDSLIETYKTYLESGLMEEDSSRIYRDEYIETLKKKLKKREDVGTYGKLFKAYESAKDLYNAVLIRNRMKELFGEIHEVKINNFNILYDTGKYSELFYQLSNLDPQSIEESQRLKELKEFFDEKEFL